MPSYDSERNEWGYGPPLNCYPPLGVTRNAPFQLYYTLTKVELSKLLLLFKTHALTDEA